MKKLFCIFFTLPLSLLCPPVEYIKELSSQLKPEYQHISPLNAMIARETDQLKRLQQTGDPQRPSTQLLELLFKIQDNRLYPHNNLSKPAAHFNPEIIADLVATLEKKSLMIPECKETQDTLLRKINAELKKKKETKSYRNNRMTRAKTAAFLETLKQADIECKQVTTGFLPALPYTALLGYLCLKYKSEDDLIDFFQHLQRNGIDALRTSDLHAMVHAHFTLEDRQSFECDMQEKSSRHSAGEIVRMIKSDRTLYEAALFTEIDITYYRGALPPVAKESDIPFRGIQVRDCINAALRTFFDHLFYDEKTFKFDPLKKLPPGVKPCQELLDFYAKYSKPSDVNGSNTIAYDWMMLMANRPQVVYHYEHHGQLLEVCARGGLPNILTVLNQLFNVEGKTSAELCKLLSTEQRRISVKTEKKEKKDIMSITFEEKGREPYTLSFEITIPVHGCVQRSKQKAATSCADYQKTIRHALLERLSSNEYDRDDHNLLAVYLSQNPADLREDIQLFIADKNISYDNLIDFYSMFDYDAEDVDLILFESVCSKLRQYPSLKPLLQNLIFDLHDDDRFYYYYNIKYLAKHKIWEIDAELADTIIKLLEQITDERYAQKAVKVLVKHQADNVPALHEVIQKYKK